MKTATIRLYEIFGAKGNYCADVLYRSIPLYRVTRDMLPASACTKDHAAQKAAEWAYKNGFTHCKIQKVPA